MKHQIATTDLVIQRVRGFAADQNLTKGRLARLAGLRDTTLSTFDKNDWNPTVKTLRALESIIPADFTP